MLCDNLEGWDGVGGRRFQRKERYIYTYSSFTLLYGRNQHYIVKQLPSNLKNQLLWKKKWVSRSLTLSLQKWGCLLCMLEQLRLQEAGLFPQVDLLCITSKDWVLLSQGPGRKGCLQVGGALKWRWRGCSRVVMQGGEVCFTQTPPMQEASTHQALCPGRAASLQRKGPLFFPTKALSAQPSPRGLHVPGVAAGLLPSQSRRSRPWQPCLAQLQEAPDGPPGTALTQGAGSSPASFGATLELLFYLGRNLSSGRVAG